MTPCILLMALLCFIDILMDRASPAKHPPCKSSVFAKIMLGSVTVMISSVGLLTLHDDISPRPIWVLDVLLVVAVVELISLGTGLRGGSSILLGLIARAAGMPFDEL